MTKTFLKLAFAGTLAFAALPASAYDGPVFRHLGVHGPALGSDHDLAVRSSRYLLTPGRMTASLVVENHGKQPVTSHVYLQFRPVTVGHTDNAPAFEVPEDGPFLQSEASAEGLALLGQTHQAARYRGIDISRALVAAGFPLLPFKSDFSGVDGDQLRTMFERGIVSRFGPQWQLDVTRSWPVSFDAGRTMTVTTSFVPVLGEFVEGLTVFPFDPDTLQLGLDGPPVSTLCLSEAQERRILALFRAIGGERPVWPYTIRDFSVTLGPPAAGFTGIYGMDFVVAPGEPGDIVSICGGAFEEQADGSMVWRTDRADPQELDIHFLQLAPAYRHLSK